MLFSSPVAMTGGYMKVTLKSRAQKANPFLELEAGPWKPTAREEAPWKQVFRKTNMYLEVKLQPSRAMVTRDDATS